MCAFSFVDVCNANVSFVLFPYVTQIRRTAMIQYVMHCVIMRFAQSICNSAGIDACRGRHNGGQALLAAATYKRQFPVFIFGFTGQIIGLAGFRVTRCAFTDTGQTFIIRRGCRSAPRMQGRGGFARLVVLNIVHAPVHCTANIACSIIQRCNELILFDEIFPVGFALRHGLNIGVFRIDQTRRLIMGYVEALHQYVNGLVAGVIRHQRLSQIPLQFADQGGLVRPYPFRKIPSIRRPRSIDRSLNGVLVQGGNIPPHASAALNQKSRVVIAAQISLTHHQIHLVKLIAKQHFYRLLNIQFQGFKAGNVESRRSVFQFL